MQSGIRNFCIIAHIDHGKSTLADRFLEVTGTIEKRKMKAQLLDQLDIERERGITIKLAPVRMRWRQRAKSKEQRALNSKPYALSSMPDSEYILNLIDTPGHIDFTYEVSRSLAAVEGAILLVDATQGVQAQTIGNLYLALDQNLEIIPVVNKIDLPNADVEKTKAEIMHLLGCKEEDILCVSGKTGAGVEDLLEAVIKRVPAPKSNADTVEVVRGTADMADPIRENANRNTPANQHYAAPLRALIFDSIYDKYRGVVAYVRIFDGNAIKGTELQFMATGANGQALETGYFLPALTPSGALSTGEIGYIVTGLKDIAGCRVGDTITNARTSGSASAHTEPLAGYKEVKPMVFAGIFPKEGDRYPELRDAIAKVKLNDGALYFEPEHSPALGFGFRCGFLGLLHLEIIEERLRREYELEIITTVPSVAYRVWLSRGDMITIKSAHELPGPSRIEKIEEPWVKADIVSPREYIGGIMQLVQDKHGIYINTEYLAPSANGVGVRVILHYEIPLSAILVDFYDKLKSVSAGYASLSYEFTEYRVADVTRLDILVAEEPIEALSTMAYRSEVQEAGKKIVSALKRTIPRAQFEIKIQAALGGKIVASERIQPFRKDVTAKLYGGDATRKMKLLEKQKKGKKKMAARGHSGVNIPSEAYLAVLKR